MKSFLINLTTGEETVLKETTDETVKGNTDTPEEWGIAEIKMTITFPIRELKGLPLYLMSQTESPN